MDLVFCKYITPHSHRVAGQTRSDVHRRIYGVVAPGGVCMSKLGFRQNELLDEEPGMPTIGNLIHAMVYRSPRA